MHIAFRADASLQIGTGHVMRCLTLADAARERGARCTFLCRPLAGNLLNLVTERGHQALSLSPRAGNACPKHEDPAHAAWLGTDWTTDAEDTGRALEAVLDRHQLDWLIVDHYALDWRWETALRSYCERLMVIDDLADRPHQADLLLDQNLGRESQDYAGLVPAHCELLIGPQYALLRPEFAALRGYSLQRRKQSALKQILISMGGVDQTNATGHVLSALSCCALPKDCRISVVMGLAAPWLKQVRDQAHNMPWPTDVRVNIGDMAARMANSDLAFGAAGSTSWERCCLGLPTLMVVLADNQKYAAAHLKHAGAADCMQLDAELEMRLVERTRQLLNNFAELNEMACSASRITDGEGVARVNSAMQLCLQRRAGTMQ